MRVTSAAICGSDLHLYGVLGAYLRRGDVLGHEFMGIVEEVGSAVGDLRSGDGVVVPFNISCGHCYYCKRGLFAQCETTQNRDQGACASSSGTPASTGRSPAVRPSSSAFLTRTSARSNCRPTVKDERFSYLSDILPTAWQGVCYADVPPGGTLAVIGLGPVGQLAVRCARRQGVERVLGVDLVDERLAVAARHGDEVVDLREVDALHSAIEAVQRGGTVSISGVYGGATDPMSMMTLFDKGVTLRMGQCHVRRWTDELLSLVAAEDDVLACEDLATHRLPLADAAEAYAMFRDKRDGCMVVRQPGLG